MLTGRLYFSDPWQKEFDAVVTGTKQDQSGYWISLSQSAFYPEGGGQPCDTGTLTGPNGECRVREVQADQQQEVWHRLEARGDCPLPKTGDRVNGKIDWEQRFDRMQQHTGEHILANCVFRIAGGFTHGLHIGQEVSSIDVTLPDHATRLPEEMLDQIEMMANRRIAEDDPIVCRFPKKDELPLLPLRKVPTVQEDVRVCMVGDYEMVACGGTHLARTSQVGQIKILYAEPARGKTRVFFLCGLRAAAHYSQSYKALREAANLLFCKQQEVPGRVGALLTSGADTRRELIALRRLQTLSKAQGLLESAIPLPKGGRVIAARLGPGDADAMDELAAELVRNSGVIAILCAPRDQKTLCLFARSEDREEDMKQLLLSCGARGGGEPAFVRGAAGDPGVLDAALNTLTHSSTLSGQKGAIP